MTFTYAGLQKLANPGYFDPRNPFSVARQMASLRHRSPIGPLVGLSLHAPTFVGLVIALGELAVGVGTLLGLWSRVAAIGGGLLALSFFLTVSWNTTPYYYGADIVFVFAWLVMFEFGNGGVLSLDGWLRNRARADTGLGPAPSKIAVPASQLRKLCARGSKCGLVDDGTCTRLAGCPVFPVEETLAPPVTRELGRRRVVLAGLAAGGVGVLTVATAGITAVVGRALGRTNRHPAAISSPGSVGSAAPSAPAASGGPSPTGAPPGTAIAAASSIARGQAKSFTNPSDGNPAWVVHSADNTFVAFSAVCTHAGCPVQYDSSSAEFVCPCHGGVYDARNGQVLQGPPPSPLPQVPIQVVNGQIRTG